MTARFDSVLEKTPLIAILRGIRPDEVSEISHALIDAGIRVIEIPLNSPDAFKSIGLLAQAAGDRAICGAGTVLSINDVEAAAGAGAAIAVSPNTDPAVIEKSLQCNLVPIPGFATVTEAFTAINAGATHLKLFPANTYGPAHIRAIRAVIRNDIAILAVGGIDEINIRLWRDAGVNGFGIGSNLYAPGRTANEVYKTATKLVAALNNR